MATATITSSTADKGGIGIVVTLDDGAGLSWSENLFFPYEQIKDVTTWNQFYNNFLKPSVSPLITKFQRIKTMKDVVDTKVGIAVTI